LILMAPTSGFKKPDTKSSRVVFPDPLGPIIDVKQPGLNETLKSLMVLALEPEEPEA